MQQGYEDSSRSYQLNSSTPRPTTKGTGGANSENAANAAYKRCRHQQHDIAAKVRDAEFLHGDYRPTKWLEFAGSVRFHERARYRYHFYDVGSWLG